MLKSVDVSVFPDTSTGLSPANASSLATDQQLQYDKLPSDCGLGSAKLIEHDVGCGLEEFPWMALLEYRTIELDGKATSV